MSAGGWSLANLVGDGLLSGKKHTQTQKPVAANE
jgi:hypothetical protein